ncbi:M14 family metallopeptidase [Paenibacillus sp. ACRRX]|uniref:M14 family metallopeptidase n=1 Tax=unclassified Paenibacillus TaxID=185978 RepID=UPI001EF41F9E|nr:M14 family metallopeptidase [Paenibacillus sp. UMB4589-SE434]MCG7405987.1 M14 family metallopeptidase [Paenibacillus sp. ACRRX]MDK8182440.1 M14 family metallopeptidase [Paenibacillus sp. UMB4589-SE434]
MSNGAIPYTIQRGDTYLRICLRYGIHLPALLAINPHIRVEEYAIPGQLIYIPQRPTNIYVVQQEESFYEIASRFRVPAQWLANANPTVNPRRLNGGQSIVIPYWTDERDVRTQAEYGPNQLADDIQRLLQRYPFIASEQIGTSVMGKPIFALGIGTGPFRVQANGAVHANEWITSALLMQFVEDYAMHYERCALWQGWDPHGAYNRTALWVVPMVNPDGVELVQEGVTYQHPYGTQLADWNVYGKQYSLWKANIRGVDLNDQFPAYWDEEKERRQVDGPSPMNYSGDSPLCEPEAEALAQFTLREPFELALSFHSQGQEIYWNYRDFEPDVSEAWARTFELASGYRAVKLSGSDAGFKDWFIQTFRKPGFTVEIGMGVNPLPLNQFERLYVEVSSIMRAALNGMPAQESRVSAGKESELLG